jgi:hypothetical protein
MVASSRAAALLTLRERLAATSVWKRAYDALAGSMGARPSTA